MDQERLKRSTGVTNVHGWVKLNLGGSETSGIATKRLGSLLSLACTPCARRTLSGKRLDSS